MGDLSIYKLVASSRFAFYTGTPFWLNSGAVSSERSGSGPAQVLRGTDMTS